MAKGIFQINIGQQLSTFICVSIIPAIETMNRNFYQSASGAPTPWAIFLVVFLAVILPRLCSLGAFVHLDEGYHAFMAQYAWHSIASGAGFPADMSGFKLFPLLFNWVWALPGNAVMWLRFVDMLFAAAAGWLFCILLARESKNAALALLLAFAFLLGINAAGAIESGFKNSFSPAFLCLFAALLITRNAQTERRNWFWAGVFTAIAVLFRETFFPFSILGCAALLLTRNFSGLWRYIAGGIAGALAITVISALARGQLLDMFTWYFTYGKIYGPEADRTIPKFIANSQIALRSYWPLLTVTVFAAVAICRLPGRQFTGRAWFWLCAAALPLIEPLMKIGFMYHFSVCLPGMAGFCAYAASRYQVRGAASGLHPKGLRGALVGTAIAACLMLPEYLPHMRRLPVTFATLNNFPAQGWPESLAPQSLPLEVVAKIKKMLKPGDRVSSSGFAYFIYPLSGTLPPSQALGDLSRTYIYAGENEKKFRSVLDNDEPEVVLLARAITEHSATFWRQLKYIFERHPDYEYVGEILPDEHKNYGWLGYMIYRKKDKSAEKDKANIAD